MITLAPFFRYGHKDGSTVSHFKYMSDPKKYNHMTVRVPDPNDPTDRIPQYWDPKWTTETQARKALKHVSLEDVLRWVKTDARLASICEAIRSEPEEAEQQHMKKMMLPTVYWGEFTPLANQHGRYKITDKGMTVHGGVLCFDADSLDPVRLRWLVNVLANDPYTFAGFVSPRGNGYKWLVRVPPVIEEHRPRYISLKEHYKRLLPDYKLDEGCINESRRCFLSSDPDMLLNEDAWTWMDFSPPKVYEPVNAQFPIDDAERIYALVHSWYKDKPFESGQRHALLVSMTMTLIDRGVPLSVARPHLERDYVSRMPSNRWAKELSDIEDLYRNKAAQFGSIKTEDFRKARDANNTKAREKILVDDEYYMEMIARSGV